LTASERERLRSRRSFCHCVRRGGATPRARGRLSAAGRRTEAQIPGRRRPRPRRERRNQWGSHREHRAPPDVRPVAKELVSSATGRDHSSRHRHQWPTAASGLKEQRAHGAQRDCSVTDGAVRAGRGRMLASRPEQQPDRAGRRLPLSPAGRLAGNPIVATPSQRTSASAATAPSPGKPSVSSLRTSRWLVLLKSESHDQLLCLCPAK
jgi:hypothetical protein